ncbi:RNB domain-containing ribonuclease [Micromonospora sp. KC606]|uniref:RNB domain-containing ribonuclease n=1 Tax=Micromonospora sp. KC606 TaxID=2530379 RepID=UPI0010520726|nr:RNB domain-containing ribonuclease [Micromonospora sp. KC606]TDC84459.1 RNB domain-containing ribonuclease [Micromonospora sp. KC606]
MVIRRVLAPRIDFGALRRELGLPDSFPVAAQREADEAAAAPPSSRVDRTDVPFVTVDPATSRDLDQAMHLSRRPGGGFRVRYAIADVAAHVRPGGPLELETWRRGQTVYLPDGNVPLHPRTLSEGAASLLPDADRAAVVWTLDLDADGGTDAVALERARVRSRAKLDYVGVQAAAETGTLPEPIALLPEIGALLTDRGLRRGAINLPLPEQDVEPDGDGWRLVLRGPVPTEDHNAQISLLTGMAAADIMLAGGIGLLRTMPPPKPEAVTRLRAAAAALGVPWPDGTSVGELLVGLDTTQSRAAAFVDQAAELMRGAAYTAFDGEPPEQPEHGGVAAAYAHVTAPLRRLADRYATEVCLALHEGRPVPDWARAALPRLPEVMAATDRTAGAATRGAIELAEAVLLAHRVGETFPAVVLDVDAPPNGQSKPGRQPGGTVALDDPPVRARCGGELPLGERIRVRLVTADPVRRTVLFARD